MEASIRSPWRRWLESNRFLGLLASLALLFVVTPFTRTGTHSPVMDLSVTLVLLGGIYAATGERGDRWLGLGFGALAIASRWAAYGSSALVLPALAINLAFLGYVVFHVLRALSRTRVVTADTVYGGISVYLLLGLIWTFAYGMALVIEPGGLRGLAPGLDLRDLLYFSFVTLTTLGYGDVAPVSPGVRVLATAEAVTGQLFVAVFIARLVALYSRRPPE